jgi:hypothetical protein
LDNYKNNKEEIRIFLELLEKKIIPIIFMNKLLTNKYKIQKRK